jgi:hypothetical protein
MWRTPDELLVDIGRSIGMHAFHIAPHKAALQHVLQSGPIRSERIEFWKQPSRR